MSVIFGVGVAIGIGIEGFLFSIAILLMINHEASLCISRDLLVSSPLDLLPNALALFRTQLLPLAVAFH